MVIERAILVKTIFTKCYTLIDYLLFLSFCHLTCLDLHFTCTWTLVSGNRILGNRSFLYIKIFKTHKTCVLIKLSLLVQSGSAFITLDGIVDVMRMRTTKKLRDVVRDLGLNIRIFHVKPVQPDTLTGAARRRLRVDTVNSTGSPL